MTTHLQTLKQAMGSHQITTVPRNSASKNTGFISKCDRFTVKTEDYIPGPGAYDGQIKEKHTSDYRVSKDDSKYSYGREHQWIIEEGRMPY